MSSKPSPVLENVTLDEEGSRTVRTFAALAPDQAPQPRTHKPEPVGTAESGPFAAALVSFAIPVLLRGKACTPGS